MKTNLNEKNYLIFGASSNIAKKYISLVRKEGDNFYGVSSKTNKVSNKYFKKIINYDDISKYSKIKFNNILIIASRNLAQGGKLNDFLFVNNLIIKSLNSINYSEEIKPKFTFLSSFSVYDKNSSYIGDDTILMPCDYYGESKILLEESLHDLSNVYNGDLLICRLPVFLYKGVSARNDNFLARLSLAIASQSSFTLANSGSFLGAVFDVKSLAKLDKASFSGIKTINCASNPDITFLEIGQLASELGLKKVDWKETDRPSVRVCLKSMSQLLGFEPSAKEMIQSWMINECKFNKIL